MRSCLLAAVCVAIATLAAPTASAEPAHLLYRDGAGALRSARLADVGTFLDGCVDSAPPSAVSTFGPPVTVTVGDRRQVFATVVTDPEVWLVASSPEAALVPEGHWCRLTPGLSAVLGAARTVPANRGPWLAFIAGFGGIGLAVALVALWGRGIGPAPTLAREPTGQPDPDSSDSTSASVT